MVVRCCGLTRGLRETSELFYACTQLSVTVVLADRTIRETVDSAQEITNDPHFHSIPLKISEPREVVLSTGDRLMICPICPHGGRIGVFVLGPYVTKPEQAKNLTYRPSSSWPYLLALLRDLQEAKTAGEERPAPFCFHVQRAVRLMERHYDENLTLGYVANHLGLNKSYFSSIFQRETGTTFTNYLNMLRVEASKELLAQSSLSILEIALETGFSNQNYYGRTFKKLTGITPSEFRRRLAISSQDSSSSTSHT
jgi:AraC-like DNA-binding protein